MENSLVNSKANVIRAAIATPLTGADVKTLLGQDVSIITYDELQSVCQLGDIFDDEGRCMLLYLIGSKTSGHWVCLQDYGQTVEFFDPYGGDGRPDSQLKWVPASKRVELGEDSPLLMKLIRESGKRLKYNKALLQQDSPQVATCGRHSAVRLLRKADPLESYTRWLLSTGNPDETVAEITYKRLGH